MQFKDLHTTENFASAINSLKGLAGDCIRCVVTGAMYIGSSFNLSKRMNGHFICSENIHLRSAILKYGISAFVFSVVEFVEIVEGVPLSSVKLLLLSREQFYLDWVFSSPDKLRFISHLQLVPALGINTLLSLSIKPKLAPLDCMLEYKFIL